ncbi:MAG: tRNA pseudouridine(13) synthase TruD [Tahibacter sp.]
MSHDESASALPAAGGVLPFAQGGPALRGQMRSEPEDFFVDEDLGFEPDGAGEHVFVRVEKRGANTDWVARELARLLAVSPEAVSYAGLKDRHAVTRQTFSIQVPIKREVDWSAITHAEFNLLSALRHSRKLKRGALRGNRFRIVLRHCQGDRASAERQLARIAAAGVPNYFGEQRFGRDASNVQRARLMLAGKRVARHERSLLLSAARSELFNRILARRVEMATWDQPMPGEVWMLAGSHSIFGPEAETPALLARIAAMDIHPTGALWGRGSLRSAESVALLEAAVAAEDAELAHGLEQAGLEQERRALRLNAENLVWHWNDDSLTVEFSLPSGCYATTLLRELVQVEQPEGADCMPE